MSCISSDQLQRTTTETQYTYIYITAQSFLQVFMLTTAMRKDTNAPRPALVMNAATRSEAAKRFEVAAALPLHPRPHPHPSLFHCLHLPASPGFALSVAPPAHRLFISLSYFALSFSVVYFSHVRWCSSSNQPTRMRWGGRHAHLGDLFLSLHTCVHVCMCTHEKGLLSDSY
jgi:hypothetical protein